MRLTLNKSKPTEIGELKSRLLDYQELIADLNNVIEIDLKNSSVFVTRHVKVNLEDFQGANNDWSQAIEINPIDLRHIAIVVRKELTNDLEGVSQI